MFDELMKIAASADSRGASDAAELLRQAALEVDAVKGSPGKMQPEVSKQMGEMAEVLDAIGLETYSELLSATKRALIDTLRGKKQAVLSQLREEFGTRGVEKATPILDDWYIGIVRDVFTEGMPSIRAVVEQVFDTPDSESSPVAVIPEPDPEPTSDDAWEDQGPYEESMQAMHIEVEDASTEDMRLIANSFMDEDNSYSRIMQKLNLAAIKADDEEIRDRIYRIAATI
jgi:hypothetical protein